MAKISSGSSLINEMLQGGYETDIITTIFGPAGSGKTNLCLIAAICTVLNKKKVIFIDTEGGFSIERVKQLCPGNDNILDKILVFNPTTFEEQKKEHEESLTLETSYTCPHCNKQGEGTTKYIRKPYKNSAGKSVKAYIIICQHCSKKIPITKKLADI